MMNKTLGVNSLTDAERKTMDDQDDKTLVEMWQAYKDSVDHSMLGLQYVEYVLQRRLEERKAKALPSTTHDVKMERGYSMDTEALKPLREHIDPEIIDTAYTPATTRPVPEKWDMRIVRLWPKFGEEVERIIEAAKLWEPARISIKKKRK